MRKVKNTYTPEKVSVKEYFGIFKGIKIPWLFFVMILVCTIGTTIAGMTLTYFTGDVVDASGEVPTAQLVSYAVGYLLVGVFSSGTMIFEGVASERINLGLRKKLWSKIIYTKQSCYDEDGGETLVSRVTTDCDFASKLFTTIVGFISLGISLGMYIVQMYLLSVLLANYMLILIPISTLIGWGYTKLRYLIAQKSQAMLARTTTYLIERTRDLALVKAANAQVQEIEAGADCFKEQYAMQIKTGLMDIFYTALQTIYQILSILIPFAVGAGLVANGHMTAGSVVAFYGFSSTVGINFTNIIQYCGDIKQANGALARVIRTFKLPDEQTDTGIQMDEPDADISFDNISFQYTNTTVLENFTCEIPKHKVTAIIGANGSGKSTVFKLLERLYEPNNGAMKFGGTDVKEYNLHAWRKAFAIVAQDSPLMEGTIRENICYGCERDIAEEELKEVAKRAGVDKIVAELEKGYDSKVVSGGTNFSGGQRQCIAIARAMMNNPDYLLLDEATSNLDVKSEKMVLSALSELMKDRTTVIIAHSLSAIRKADHVIILEDGKAACSGSPEEVLKSSGSYLAKVMNRRQKIGVESN